MFRAQGDSRLIFRLTHCDMRNFFILLIAVGCLVGTRELYVRSHPHVSTNASDGRTLVEWPPRTEPHRWLPSVPALVLEFEPTDVYGWRPPTNETPHEVGLTPLSSTLVFDVLSPSGDAARQVSSNAICAPDKKRLFAGCLAGRARLVLARGEGGLDSDKSFLDGGEPPVQRGGPFQVGPYGDAVSMDYWVRENVWRERDQFLGWQCQGRTIRGTQDFAPSRQSLAPAFAGCYEPGQDTGSWMVSSVKKRRLWIRCNTPKASCEMAFSFRGRLAKVDDEHLPGADRAAARAVLFASAWDMLSRMRMAAAKPAVPTAITEALGQAVTCQAVSNVAHVWHDEYVDNLSRLLASGQSTENIVKQLASAQGAGDDSSIMEKMTASCRVAQSVAHFYASRSPREVEPLAATLASATADWSQDHLRAYLASTQFGNPTDLFVELTRNNHGGQSLEYFKALALDVGNGGASLASHPDAAQRVALADQVLALWPRYGKMLQVKDRIDLLEAVSSQYFWVQKADKDAAALGLMIQELEAAYGKTSTRLLMPMRRRLMELWYAEDVPTAIDIADALYAVWQSLPPDTPEMAPNGGNDGGWPMAGFDIAFLDTLIAFKTGEFERADKQVSDVVARMEQRLGSESPFVLAANYHLREIKNRQRTLPTSRGGGFLPRHY